MRQAYRGGGEWAALCGGGEAQLGHQLGLRVQVEAVAEAVQQGGVALILAGDLHLGQAGDLHQPQQHGGVAVHTAAAGHQAQQLPPVQGQYLAG